MLRHAGVEGIGGQAVLAGEEAKAGFGDDQVEIAGPNADGAVALRDADLGWGLDLEPDAAAVAAAGVLHRYSIQPRAADPAKKNKPTTNAKNVPTTAPNTWKPPLGHAALSGEIIEAYRDLVAASGRRQAPLDDNYD